MILIKSKKKQKAKIHAYKRDNGHIVTYMCGGSAGPLVATTFRRCPVERYVGPASELTCEGCIKVFMQRSTGKKQFGGVSG